MFLTKYTRQVCGVCTNHSPRDESHIARGAKNVFDCVTFVWWVHTMNGLRQARRLEFFDEHVARACKGGGRSFFSVASARHTPAHANTPRQGGKTGGYACWGQCFGSTQLEKNIIFLPRFVCFRLAGWVSHQRASNPSFPKISNLNTTQPCVWYFVLLRAESPFGAQKLNIACATIVRVCRKRSGGGGLDAKYEEG